MEEEKNNVISIYTPSVTLNSPEEYAKRIGFLVQLLASKNCPTHRAQEIVKEIKNLTGYLYLTQLRRLHLEEQQKANEQELKLFEKEQEAIKLNQAKKEQEKLKQAERKEKIIKTETTPEINNEGKKNNRGYRDIDKMYSDSRKRTIEYKKSRQIWFFVFLGISFLVFVLFYYIF